MDNRGRGSRFDEGMIERLAKRAHENNWGNTALEDAIKREVANIKSDTLQKIRQLVQAKQNQQRS